MIYRSNNELLTNRRTHPITIGQNVEQEYLLFVGQSTLKGFGRPFVHSVAVGERELEHRQQVAEWHKHHRFGTYLVVMNFRVKISFQVKI